MTTQAGIWIDKEQAILVKISEANQEVIRFKVDHHEAVTQEAIAGSPAASQVTHRPYEYLPEGRVERKKFADRKRMYLALEDSLQGADGLLLIGPGETKGEFAKHIALKRLPLAQLTVEASDRMTEPQLVAKVREHFAELKRN